MDEMKFRQKIFLSYGSLPPGIQKKLSLGSIFLCNWQCFSSVFTVLWPHIHVYFLSIGFVTQKEFPRDFEKISYCLTLIWLLETVGNSSGAQCPRIDLNKSFLPRPNTTTVWMLKPHRSKISKNWNPPWRELFS